MQIQILCIGKIKDHWIAEGIAEFEKRLKPYVTVTVTELADVRIPDAASSAEEKRVKEKEGELLRTAVKSGFVTFALDPRGKPISSEELATQLNTSKLAGKNICFIIGGPLGLSETFLASVDRKLSFSALTFTHTMCRLILFEQIYRAFKILAGEPYHK